MTHLIEEMLAALRPVLKNRVRAKEILERYWQDMIAVVWEVADVHRAANERELSLTDKEAMEVLEDLNDHYNPQSGIKWEDIYAVIKNKGFGRKLTKRELSQFLSKDIITASSVR